MCNCGILSGEGTLIKEYVSSKVDNKLRGIYIHVSISILWWRTRLQPSLIHGAIQTHLNHEQQICVNGMTCTQNRFLLILSAEQISYIHEQGMVALLGLLCQDLPESPTHGPRRLSLGILVRVNQGRQNLFNGIGRSLIVLTPGELNDVGRGRFCSAGTFVGTSAGRQFFHE